MPKPPNLGNEVCYYATAYLPKASSVQVAGHPPTGIPSICGSHGIDQLHQWLPMYSYWTPSGLKCFLITSSCRLGHVPRKAHLIYCEWASHLACKHCWQEYSLQHAKQIPPLNSHYIIYAVNIITIEMATNWLGMLILWPQFVQEIYWNSDS